MVNNITGMPQNSYINNSNSKPNKFLMISKNNVNASMINDHTSSFIITKNNNNNNNNFKINNSIGTNKPKIK